MKQHSITFSKIKDLNIVGNILGNISAQLEIYNKPLVVIRQFHVEVFHITHSNEAVRHKVKSRKPLKVL